MIILGHIDDSLRNLRRLRLGDYKYCHIQTLIDGEFCRAGSCNGCKWGLYSIIKLELDGWE